MSQPNGINPDERVVFTVGATYQKFTGEIIVTNRGVIFLKATGMFRTGRERLHNFPFEHLQGIRIEKKGLFGIHLAIDERSIAWGNRTYRYSLSENNAKQVIGAVEAQKKRLKAPAEIESLIMSLVKPKGEADIQSVARNQRVRLLVARLQGVGVEALRENQFSQIVRNIVVRLISTGKLDGIITEENRYVSNTMLARKTVQYQVVVDFNTLYSQLENKGIVLQTLECPSCNGKLEYPKDGDTVECRFCSATVHALDVFKKFKELL